MSERLIKRTIDQLAFYIREDVWNVNVAKRGDEQSIPQADLMRIAEYVVDTHTNSLVKSRYLVEDIIDELMLTEDLAGEMCETLATQEEAIDKDRALFGVLRDVLESYAKDEDDIRKTLREFFRFLDYTEESDGGTLFNPVRITSCRALMTPKIDAVLDKMKAFAVGDPVPQTTQFTKR